MANSKKVVARSSDVNADWVEQQCVLDLPEFIERDVLNFQRTINYPVSGLSRDPREIMVEVDIHMRFTRETGGLVLGDPIHSQTLLPGETVRLTMTDRRSRFSFDSQSSLSYKSVQMSESQYYMSALRHFSADGEAEQGGSSSSDYKNNWDFHGDAEGGLGFLSVSAQTNARGSFNSHSASEYLNNQRYHAESAESSSVEATHKNMSVSVGEVNTRTHQEGTSEDQYESSSRTFKNENRCHALTYMFYQVSKKQTVTFELVAIEFRIKDPNSLTSISHLRPGNRTVKLIPQQLPVSSDNVLKALDIESRYQTTLNNPDGTIGGAGNFNIPKPTYDADLRKEAIKKAKNDFTKEGILTQDGAINPALLETINFKKESALPTGGVVVKGYLDECETCEPMLKDRYQIENERMQLENDLLRKQIDLLDKSQEYRCCPCDCGETGTDTNS